MWSRSKAEQQQDRNLSRKSSPNVFQPTVQTFAVWETDVSRHSEGTSGAPLKPLRDDSALRALSTLRGLREVPEDPPLCRETWVSRTANVGTVGMNGLRADRKTASWPNELKKRSSEARQRKYYYMTSRYFINNLEDFLTLLHNYINW